MKTMITVIADNLSLDKCDIDYLGLCRIAENVYLTKQPKKVVMSVLYGGGYNGNEVLVSTLEQACIDVLNQNNQIVK